MLAVRQSRRSFVNFNHMQRILELFRNIGDLFGHANDWFRGKRTYIIAAAIFCLGGARAMDWIDQQTFEAWFAILTGGGISSLRAAKDSSSYGRE